MNNLRLLAGMLCAALLSAGVCTYGQSVITLEAIFESAEAHSAQLRPFLTAISETDHEIKMAKIAKLPDINASLNLSYLGDGFITKRDFTEYQKASIPHLGTGLSLTVSQPVYTGGAITNSIKLAELKSTASRFANDLQRDNIRFQLAGFYLDIYKGAVMGATLGPALIGEWFRHAMAKNASLLGSNLVDFNPSIAHHPLGELYGMVQKQSMLVSMKEIYGWLLIIALISLLLILVAYGPLRPWAIFPKWSSIRRQIKKLYRTQENGRTSSASAL